MPNYIIFTFMSIFSPFTFTFIYILGDIDAAQGMLNHCLEVDASYSDAHILMAQVSKIIKFTNL